MERIRTTDIIAPSYGKVELNVPEVRQMYADFGDVMDKYDEALVSTVTDDPEALARYNHHRTNYQTFLDMAKDACIKAMIAKTTPLVSKEMGHDGEQSVLFGHMEKRKRES